MKILQSFALFFSLIFLVSCTSNKDDPVSPDKKITNTQIETSKTLLALGDSLTAGYGLEVDESYPAQLEKILKNAGYDYRVINAGVSGDTSATLRDRLEWVLEGSAPPDLVFLVIGANDGLQGLSVSELKKNIISIVEVLQENNIQVVLGGMKLPWNYGGAYRNSFEKVYQEIAEEKQLPLLPFFLEGVALDQKLNQWDRIHPTGEWYAIIAKNVFDFLRENRLITE